MISDDVTTFDQAYIFRELFRSGKRKENTWEHVELRIVQQERMFGNIEAAISFPREKSNSRPDLLHSRDDTTTANDIFILRVIENHFQGRFSVVVRSGLEKQFPSTRDLRVR